MTFNSERVNNIKYYAKGRWLELFTLAGINSDFLKKSNVPCPLCGGTDRFSLSKNPNYEGFWYCRGCGRGDGISLIQKFLHLNFEETLLWLECTLGIKPIATDESNKSQRNKKDDYNKRVKATLRALSESHEIKVGSASWNYLLYRGISPEVIKKALNLSEMDASSYWDENAKLIGTFPTMVAAIHNAGGVAQAIHKTYLTKDGKKANVPSPKKVSGALGDNSPAIELFELGDTLGVAEGIETALSVTQLTGIPCWSLISANQFAKFKLPLGVKHFFIFGDNDISYTGQRASYDLAYQIKRDNPNCEVSVKIPEKNGWDWNDVLNAK